MGRGLSREQREILEILKENPDLELYQIGRMLRLDPDPVELYGRDKWEKLDHDYFWSKVRAWQREKHPHISRSLQRLIKRGLVERFSAPSEHTWTGKAYHYRLTPTA